MDDDRVAAGRIFPSTARRDKSKALRVHGLEIVGYDPETDTFPSTVYSSLEGILHFYHWDVRGNVVTHWDADSKYMGTFSDGRVLSGGWRPIEGHEGPENFAYAATMIRVE